MCDGTIRDDADHPEALAVLNSLQHLQELRAVLNSLLSLGAQRSKTKQSKSNEDKAKQSKRKAKQKQTLAEHSIA